MIVNRAFRPLRPIYIRRYSCGISRGAVLYRRLLRLHQALNWRDIMESGMQMSLRQRRVWVHETLQTRDHRGEYHTLVRELHSAFPVGGRIQHIGLFDGRHLVFWWPRYASLPASPVTGSGMTTAKQKR